VTTEELDVALEELENRLERLRALYEQYFLGFEKIEPQVARKDVDRRIYVLRREKIRNTGKRFKLQTIIQRYNTFQQYWQRICREIENGTYKRHLLRAERQMTPEMQLTIASRRRFGRAVAVGQDTAEAASSSDSPNAFSPSEAPTEVAKRRDEPAPSEPPDSQDLATGRPPSPSSDTVAKRAPPPKPQRRPLSSQPDPSEAAAKLESLELDMGFLGSWVPPAPKAAPPVSAPKAAPVPKLDAPAKPKSSPQAAPPPKPKSSPLAAPPPKPAAAAAPARPKSTPRAAPPPKPAAPPPKPASPAQAPRAATLSDDRVRDLHEKLAALKKENREAGQVSLESLAKTIRETESKLREKHQGRKIDFEVVLRDGKAIVKPTVR
jgi:hypothetical protein